jgi:hypothetical protein
MVNTFTALTNQVVRILGGSGRNQGWPYFDGTFKEYPVFKRKFSTYQDNYHRLRPQRELVQMFREMCLPERVAARIRRAESMHAAWAILDTFYADLVQFARDLMQDIQTVQKIRENDFLRSCWSITSYSKDTLQKRTKLTKGICCSSQPI